MNSEMKQLLNKFLEGTTTLEEEKLLGRMLADNDVPVELKALAELLKAEPCDASDAEEWLTEDLTDEFDRIVSRRMPSTTLSEEQLKTILAAHQAKLREIDDSVDMAHIKDYIENDEQLYKIGQKALCLTCED